jgi:hypothetical protein
MKLVPRQTFDTVAVPICDTFVVTVRESSRAELQRLVQQASSKLWNPRTGEYETKVDGDRLLALTIRHQIETWSGLTADIITELAPLPVGSDEVVDLEPLVNGSGEIRCDHDQAVWTDPTTGKRHTLPEYLWLRAYPAQFSRLIDEISARLKDAKRAREEAEKKTCAG